MFSPKLDPEVLERLERVRQRAVRQGLIQDDGPESSQDLGDWVEKSKCTAEELCTQLEELVT